MSRLGEINVGVAKMLHPPGLRFESYLRDREICGDDSRVSCNVNVGQSLSVLLKNART